MSLYSSLPAGWLDRKIVEQFCLEDEGNGKRRLTTGVIDSPVLWLKFRKELDCDVTTIQYRGALKRLCFDQGAGYRPSPLRSDLRRLLADRISDLGRKRWPCFKKPNAEQQRQVDELPLLKTIVIHSDIATGTVDRALQIVAHNTINDIGAVSGCSSTMSTNRSVAEAGAGLTGSKSCDHATVLEHLAVSEFQIEPIPPHADKAAAKVSLASTVGLSVDSSADVSSHSESGGIFGAFSDAAAGAVSWWVGNSSPVSGDSASELSTSGAVGADVRADVGAKSASVHDAFAPLIRSNQGSYKDSEEHSGIDSDILDLLGAKDNLVEQSNTQDEDTSAVVEQMSQLHVSISEKFASNDTIQEQQYQSLERHYTRCFKYPELMGFILAPKRQPIDHSPHAYTNAQAIGFFGKDVTQEYHQPLTMWSIARSAALVVKATMAGKESWVMQSLLNLGFNCVDENGAKCIRYYDVWGTPELFNDEFFVVAFSPTGENQLLREPGPFRTIASAP